MLLITIAKGTTPDARRELTCYTQAYSAQTIHDTAEAVTLLTMDADAAHVFEAMDHNRPTEIITDEEAITAAIMAA